MKKFASIMILILFSIFAHAYDFSPTNVKEMDITIETKVLGNFSGVVTKGDKLEIKFLSIPEYESQTLVYLQEFMKIGDKIITPEHETQEGIYYAVYKIENLYEFASTPEFVIERNARIRKNAEIGINKDYNLSNLIIGFDEFLEQTDYMEVDDQELRSKTNLEFTSDSELEIIRSVSEWVNNNIDYDFENYYNGVWSAKETYNSRAGVCDEFANLTGAFLRIKGIPVKYVSGTSFDGERFGLHGWIEAYLPETGWIGVDSTYGEAGYVDGAHFIIAKTIDANKAVDFIAKTTSRKPIQLSSELQLPEIKINSVKFFENLLETKIYKPSKVQPNEFFQISAELKNISGKNAIFPVELLVHEDFQVVDSARLVYLKDNEKKEIFWDVKSPSKEFESMIYNYGMAVMVPDGNISDVITLIPKAGSEKESAVIIKDISPFVSENELEIKIHFKNLGEKKGTATIESFFDGISVTNGETEIDGLAEKIYNLKINEIRSGTVTLKIITDKETVVEINIPEKIETQELEVIEIEPETQKEPETNNNTVQIPLFTDEELLLSITGALLVISLLLIVILKMK